MKKQINLLLTVFVLCAFQSAHARFTQADTWQGIPRQPVTLNKYTYANIDPVNHIDPSGHYSLVSTGTAITILGILAVASTGDFGFSQVMTGTNNNVQGHPGKRGWSAWDAVAASMMVSAINTTLIAPGDTPRRRNPNDWHHTIPIHLCGAISQKLSSINRVQHRALHGGLAAVGVALATAENQADRVIPLGRRRNGEVLSLAETSQGRRIISNAIQGFYQTGGWLNQGSPTIGSIFPQEKKEFINGKTSLPDCKRRR